MTNGEIVLLAAYGVVLAIVAARHVVYAAVMSNVVILRPYPPEKKLLAPAEANVPKVSIIVPAKDEQAGIVTCVRALLAQDYPNLDVLVVDDRSEDQTAALVEELAQSEPRLRLLRVTQLPEGWTGKTHSLHLGQQQVNGEWLLFVDADTQLHPSCTRVVLADAQQAGADLESLLPALASSSFWERVIQPFAGVCLMVFYPLPKVNDPRQTKLGFANGQFILIKRSAYDTIGGHAGVRDKFVEDIHLGRKIRQAGLGLRVVMAPALVAVRMYASLGQIVRGWSRILYSAVDGRPAKLWVLLFSLLLFSGLAYGLLIGGGLAWLAGWRTPFANTLLLMAIVHQVLQTTLMARIYATSHSRLGYLLFRPLAVAVMLYITVRTLWICRTGQVTWRGTTYGANLRQG